MCAGRPADENPGVSVALVEAGLPDTATEIHSPPAFPALFKTRWDWDFDSESGRGIERIGDR